MADDGLPESWPDRMEMVRELRRAVGLFDGALPITPQAAWEEAIERVKRLDQGQCAECLRGNAVARDVMRRLIQRGVVAPCTDSKGNHALQSGDLMVLNPDEAVFVAALFNEPVTKPKAKP